MKQRTTLELLPRHALPVQPTQVTASTTEFSRAGQQVARLMQTIQTFQRLLPSNVQQPGVPVASNGTPLFPSSEALSISALATRLKTVTQLSGLFYESQQAQWAQGKLPLTELWKQPQNQAAAQRPQLLSQQLELLQQGFMRIDVEPWPQASLQWLVQPDPHPLVQQWRKQKGGEPPEQPSWQSELKLTLPRLGELRAQLRLQGQQLQLQLQCEDKFRDAIAEATTRLAARLRVGLGLDIKTIQVSSSSPGGTMRGDV